MFSYILKRIGLMFVTFFIIMTMCFTLIHMLIPSEDTLTDIERAKREALGYDKPIIVQYGIYLKNLSRGDFGVSWKIQTLVPVQDIIFDRLPPTILLNVYSIVFSVPIGIVIGIYAALRKNKWQDHVLSTGVMIFISVPSYVYAFVLQYFVAFKLGWFPLEVAPLSVGGWLSWPMFKSMILPTLALSFGTIAGLARFTRAELTEVLTSEFMLLARTKGLTKKQAVVRHALNNAMVPILPSIISMFVGILGGSLIIEKIFSVPGVGSVTLLAIERLDYDVFMASTLFYTGIGLAASILIDLSYGFIDPRVRMGAKK